MQSPLNRHARTVALLAGIILASTAFAQDTAAVVPDVAQSPNFILTLVMRWTHIFSAIILLGGSVFLRFVLLPAAAQTLDQETLGRLRPAMTARWKKIVMVLMVLFLVSGFYTYIAVGVPAHRGDGTYHMLFGIKFLLAMLIFLLASLITGRTSLAQKLQANNKMWLVVSILLGVAVVCIAGVMKMI